MLLPAFGEAIYTRGVIRMAVRMSAICTPRAVSVCRRSLNTGRVPSGSEIVKIAVNGTPSVGISSPARVRYLIESLQLDDSPTPRGSVFA
jgi:hypothetical protein